MLKFPLGKFNNGMVSSAFQTLNNTKLDAVTSYRVLRLIKTVDKAMQAAELKRHEMMKKYCVLDDKGDIKFETSADPRMGKQAKFKDDDSQKAFLEEFGTYMTEQELEVKIHPLDWSSIEHAALSGQELAAIEDFIAGVPEDV